MKNVYPFCEISLTTHLIHWGWRSEGLPIKLQPPNLSDQEPTITASNKVENTITRAPKPPREVQILKRKSPVHGYSGHFHNKEARLIHQQPSRSRHVRLLRIFHAPLAFPGDWQASFEYPCGKAAPLGSSEDRPEGEICITSNMQYRHLIPCPIGTGPILWRFHALFFPFLPLWANNNSIYENYLYHRITKLTVYYCSTYLSFAFYTHIIKNLFCYFSLVI